MISCEFIESPQWTKDVERSLGRALDRTTAVKIWKTTLIKCGINAPVRVRARPLDGGWKFTMTGTPKTIKTIQDRLGF